MAYLKYNLQMFASDEGGDKTEEPTAKKLEDARKEGQTARSQDLTSAVSLLAFFVILKIYIGFLGSNLLENFVDFYRHISDYANDEFTLGLACAVLGEVIKNIFILIWPMLLISFVVTIITTLFQVKWKVSAKPMQPKPNKISPISGFKRLFSKDNIVKLLTSTAKIIAMGVIVYDYLQDKWSYIMDMYHFTLNQAIALTGDIIINVGLRISLVFFIIGLVDYLYQKWKFHKDMMMTKQEVKDEYKNAEGDPKVKSQQRSRMQQASQRRMMQELPQADVVITNPTHLAVAIKYDKEKYDAPIVVAKGADYLAERIKDVARANKIEIVENKPLARMLYHNVDLGEQIPPELYQMVAEVLAYVYGLQGKV